MNNSLPQTRGLKVQPFAAEVFIDMEREKQFVTLLYRHKQAGPRDRQWALVLAVLDDLSAAGVLVRPGGLEIRLTPETPTPGAVQTPDTPYSVLIKVPIKPQAAQGQADLDAFAAGIRADFAAKGKGKKR